MDAPRDQHDEHPVAPCDRPLDNRAVVRLSGNDGDAPFERVEFSYAALPAHADHLIASIQRVLDHVSPELPRRPDDAYLHLADHVVPSIGASLIYSTRSATDGSTRMARRAGR